MDTAADVEYVGPVGVDGGAVMAITHTTPEQCAHCTLGMVLWCVAKTVSRAGAVAAMQLTAAKDASLDALDESTRCQLGSSYVVLSGLPVGVDSVWSDVAEVDRLLWGYPSLVIVQPHGIVGIPLVEHWDEHRSIVFHLYAGAVALGINTSIVCAAPELAVDLMGVFARARSAASRLFIQPLVADDRACPLSLLCARSSFGAPLVVLGVVPDLRLPALVPGASVRGRGGGDDTGGSDSNDAVYAAGSVTCAVAGAAAGSTQLSAVCSVLTDAVSVPELVGLLRVVHTQTVRAGVRCTGIEYHSALTATMSGMSAVKRMLGSMLSEASSTRDLVLERWVHWILQATGQMRLPYSLAAGVALAPDTVDGASLDSVASAPEGAVSVSLDALGVVLMVVTWMWACDDSTTPVLYAGHVSEAHAPHVQHSGAKTAGVPFPVLSRDTDGVIVVSHALVEYLAAVCASCHELYAAVRRLCEAESCLRRGGVVMAQGEPVVDPALLAVADSELEECVLAVWQVLYTNWAGLEPGKWRQLRLLWQAADLACVERHLPSTQRHVGGSHTSSAGGTAATTSASTI